MKRSYHISLPRTLDNDVNEYAKRHPHLIRRGDILRSLVVLGLRQANCLGVRNDLKPEKPAGQASLPTHPA